MHAIKQVECMECGIVQLTDTKLSWTYFRNSLISQGWKSKQKGSTVGWVCPSCSRNKKK